MRKKGRSRERLPNRPPQTGERAREVARGFVRAIKPNAQVADVDAVLLGVSELVSNAVRHAGGVTDFHLEATHGGVEVSVSDASVRRPRTVQINPSVPGGFGWLLVRELASEVTVVLRPGEGKTIRAAFPLRA
ncbi:ATP-binding protein [Streptomyces sp. TRM43335]|uniref:ATP-binding protein n=1 Tax=Streptomyces taklimakanensis TaxID=2569853 RepID=A0A6G2B990_9ACTN|nr:ATP-binding protein [Streptomyces taklimakanensis]MTE18794.1 ATP-binding protein [Streptomyces taklimakanensis]